MPLYVDALYGTLCLFVCVYVRATFVLFILYTELFSADICGNVELD